MTDQACVLIVEDEPAIAETYALDLDDDYNVRIAHYGEEALEKLDSTVDVVLLDRRMPGISGDEVLSEIESRGLGCRVAMVSAVEPDFDIVDMGFDDYVKKPVFGEELCETVERLLTLSTYDEKIQEYFAIASKRAILKGEKSPKELKESNEFQQLEDTRADLEQELDAINADLADEDLSAIFS